MCPTFQYELHELGRPLIAASFVLLGLCYTTGARARLPFLNNFTFVTNTKQRYMASLTTAWRRATRTEGEKLTVANLVYEEHISNDSFLQPTTLHNRNELPHNSAQDYGTTHIIVLRYQYDCLCMPLRCMPTKRESNIELRYDAREGSWTSKGRDKGEGGEHGDRRGGDGMNKWWRWYGQDELISCRLLSLLQPAHCRTASCRDIRRPTRPP